MNDTAYRFQYTAEENRYLTDEGRESQTADNRVFFESLQCQQHGNSKISALGSGLICHGKSQ